MTDNHSNKLKFLIALIFVIQYVIINNQSQAQLVLTTTGSTEIIDFTGFTGSGFSPTPAPGQLDSKTWSVTGFGDGDSGFDSTKTTGDFARGSSNGGETQGGIYAFDVGGDTILGVQPTGTDFTPGSFILKIQNNTGSPVMQLDVSYEIWVYNDNDRANALNFSYSSDNLTYTDAPGLDFTTIEVADSPAVWTMMNRSITITDTIIANNDFFYLKWTGSDVSGAGSRDEYGINNIQVTAIPSLLADFSFADACLGETVCFTDLSTTTGSTIIQWLWDFGDGFTSSQQNPCHIYADTGIYSVQLIVTDDSSNVDTVTQILNIYPVPVAGFSSTNVCLGDSTQFSDMSTISMGSITSWNWDFGDGVGTSTFQNPIYSYVASGTYIVTLMVTSDNGCASIIGYPVDVFPTPVIDTSLMVIDSSNCGISDGAIMGITASGGTPSLTYEWVDDSLTVVGGDSANLVNVPSGSYALTVIDLNGCSATSGPHMIVDLGAPPAPTAASPSSYCEGDAIAALTATGTSGTLVWYTDAALTDSVFSGSPFASGATTDTSFWVAETVSGCEGPATQVDITVNPIPAAGFTTASVCLYDSAVFTDLSTISSGTINSWQWDFGDGTSSIQNPAHLFSTDGTYNVSLAATSDNGCVNTVVQSLTIYPVPAADFTTINFCLNDTTLFADLSTINSPDNIVSWQWNFGDGFSVDTNQNPSHNYMDDSLYFVTLSVTSNNGCIGSALQTVEIYPLPSAGFTSSTTGLNVSFTDASAGTALIYSWDFGDGTGTSIIDNPVYIYSSAASYNVCLTVTDSNGCEDVFCESVTVVETGIQEQNPEPAISIYPNPTNNGMVNIDFGNAIYGDVQLTVYNILGEAVQQGEMVGQGKQVIDLSGFTKGVYLLYFRPARPAGRSGNFSVAKKISVQ